MPSKHSPTVHRQTQGNRGQMKRAVAGPLLRFVGRSSGQREPLTTLAQDSSADWLPFGNHSIPGRAVRFRVVVTNAVDYLDGNTMKNPLRLFARNSVQRFGDRLDTLGDFRVVPH